MNKKLLFIPGFLSPLESPNFLEKLAKSFEIQTFNFVENWKGDAEDLEERLRLQVQSFSPDLVYAYSMGGRLLLNNLERFTKLPEKIILESVSLENLADEGQERLRKDQERAQKMIEDFESFIKSWYRMPMWHFSKDEYQEMVSSKLKMKEQRKSWAEILVALSPGHYGLRSLEENLELLKCSASYMAGNEDEKYRGFLEKAERLTKIKVLPGLKFHLVDNVGHNIHFQNGDKVVEVVLNFL